MTQVLESDRNISLAARQNLIADFPVSRTGTISGTVFLDANRNGRRDPEEGGVRDAVVRLANSQVLTFSDQNGAFTISNVPPGQRALEVDTRFVPGAAAAYDVTTQIKPLFLGSGANVQAGAVSLAPREKPIETGQLPPSGEPSQPISAPVAPPAKSQAETTAAALPIAPAVPVAPLQLAAAGG